MSSSSKRSVRKVTFTNDSSNQGVQAGQIDTVTINQQATQSGRDQEDLLHTYICRLHKSCNTLAFGDPQSDKPGQQMKMAEVFTMLRVQVRSSSKKRKPDIADFSPPAISAIAKERECLLLGKPGGGKTTVVAYLSLSLAEAQPEFPDQSPGGGLTRLGPEWQSDSRVKKAPLPIKVLLKNVTENIWQGVSELWSDDINHDNRLQLIALLEKSLRNGKALLLLDGLDEVPLDLIQSVQDVIADARLRFRKSRILITCRSFDYDNEVSRQVAGLPELVLQDFDRRAQDQFIDNWYQELVRTGRRSESEAKSKRDNLKDGLRKRQELAKLTGTPLLLALIVLVHTEEGELPSARSLFYQRCVRLLLLRWRAIEGVATSLDEGRLLTLAAEVGYAAHSEEQKGRDEESIAGLTRGQIREIAIHFFERAVQGKNEEIRRQAEIQGVTAAQRLVNSNGLLLPAGNDRYTFAHRTFQEFLAGQYLGVGSRRQLVLKLASDPHWRIALLLMAGYGAREGNSIDYVLLIVEHLIKSTQAEQLIAAEMLAEIGQEPLRDKGYDEILEGEGLWPRTVEILNKIAFSQPESPDLLICNRAAEILDLLDEDHRPELCLTSPDYWAARIEPGSFLMGDDASRMIREKPAFIYNIRQPYALAKFPVTNRQYQQFLKHLIKLGKYEEARKHRPLFWTNDNYQVGQGSHPVYLRTGDSAWAFADWANSILHEEGILASDELVRPPTEPEWERAAAYPVAMSKDTSGIERRRYPWERRTTEVSKYYDYKKYAASLESLLTDDQLRFVYHSFYALEMSLEEISDTHPDKLDVESLRRLLRSADLRIRRNSIVGVGIFPFGPADCGAKDMLGPVGECCCTPLYDYPLPKSIKPQRLDTSTADGALRYAVRGGPLRTCSSRSSFTPLFSMLRIGLRLARVFPRK